jgi:hypothetical protein
MTAAQYKEMDKMAGPDEEHEHDGVDEEDGHDHDAAMDDHHHDDDHSDEAEHQH